MHDVSLERPTLRTVAREAGVSRTTVSNVFSDPDRVADGTRERVLAVARELGYPGPDPAARSLRRRKAGAIGLVLGDDLVISLGNIVCAAFLAGFASELGLVGCAAVVLPPGPGCAAVLREVSLDAIVLAGTSADGSAALAVADRRLPTLVPVCPTPAGDDAETEARAGGRQAARDALDLVALAT